MSQSLTTTPCCIHEFFEAQAKRTPDAIAVSCEQESLTYGELDAHSAKLAQYLARLGVGPEVPVALYLERSIQMVVAILGVLRAGGAYVPIDLAYPKDRLKFMLEDTRAPILLTQASLLRNLPEQSAKVVCLDTGWAIVDKEPAQAPCTTVSRENIAYIIYTSGSTGNPKGVLVTHHNVVRLLTETEQWYGFNSSDVWPLFHSYAFDVSVWELWGALFYGGRLVVVPYLVTRSPQEFYELLAREKVTVLNQTPSAFRQLIWAEGVAPTKHELNLRFVICAGEALELQSLKPWFERHGDNKPLIVNKYGITETTVHSTYRVIRKSDLTGGTGSVIGVPIPDLQIYLVDENLKPVPSGTPGEICVGGAGVARGYLNRPELTAQRFLKDPFSDAAGSRLYRSGDLAKINAHGELEYLGRIDHQVKIRGFRVELGEIEAALNRHPAIRESVVIARDRPGGDKRLVAYAVPVNTQPTVTELREHLGRILPDYMLPAVFVFLQSLPLTTNGKVDRHSLPDPDAGRPELKVDYVSARTPAEQVLSDIWSGVLELEKVGIYDNYFELGGDSIRSIIILSKAQQAGLSFSLQEMFQYPTVAGLASRAERTSRREAPQASQPFSLVAAEDRLSLPPDAEDAYPMTRLQLGMFYFNELDPLSAIYHDVFSYRLRAVFAAEKFSQTLQRFAERHPLIRTSFHLTGFSQPLQIVHRTVRVPLTVEDLSGLPAAEQDQRVVNWVDAEKRRPFERSAPPLVRFHVQIRDQNSFQLFFSFHHACVDGWSLAAAVTELLRDYSALLNDSPREIASPRLAYRDFVALELDSIQSEETRRFWATKLDGASPQLLPRWPKSMCAGGHEQVRGPELGVPSEVYCGLRQMAQRSAVPLKTVLLAAHLRVMATLDGQSDVVSGLVCNGRPEQADGEKLIGLFLNLVPLRLQLNGGTWLNLVRNIFAAEQELLPFRRLPLAEIQRVSGGKPLFETAFDFVHFHVYRGLQECHDLDLAEGHYFEANNLTAYTTFMLDVTSSRLNLHIDYDPNVLSLKQVEDISSYYLSTLRAIATHPDTAYEKFSPLSDNERKQILGEWNGTAEKFPDDKCIDELFAARTAEAPDSVAVTFENQVLTYRELNARANHLARALQGYNVKPGVPVGLCVERSPEMVVALLAVLKARGAYVPLDPAYPRERLRFMLEDSQATVLLTQKSLLELLPETTAKTVLVDDIFEAEALPPSPPHSPEPRNSSDLAYVIYTSGSTGRPKGVPISHRSIANLLFSAAKVSGFSSDDTLLAVTTLSFDIAALELFMPLVIGAKLELASRETAGDGTRLAALLESADATFMQATPATWRLLLEAGWQGRKQLTVFCGGEALKPDLAKALLTHARNVWNFYGPTETTIWSTAWKVQPDEPVRIGRPLANTRLYVLDQHLNPVPVGVVGELHIGGEGLSRGYWNRPDLTVEKFIHNPFAEEAGKRLYKTGDLARYLPDGTIECLGRVDHQVKIRGFRIEPGEIEGVLRQHAAVSDALVATREDGLGEARLVAYVISKGSPPSLSEMREFLRARLPFYMVPSQFVLLQQFPLTPNGKVNVRLLPTPENAQELPRTCVAPRNQDERTLARIWQEVLLTRQIGIDDNFFELGGDSLSATRAFARINTAFGMSVCLREMLERPTIRSLGEFLSRSEGASSAIPPLVAYPRRAV